MYRSSLNEEEVDEKGSAVRLLNYLVFAVFVIVAFGGYVP